MVEIVHEKIDIETLLAQTEDVSTGGLVVFIGRVRDHADGKSVLRMEYHGYEKMALAEMQKLEQQAKTRWPVKKIAIVHRLGTLELGEASVVIAVSCAHRREAFEACKFAIDQLKVTVPIWKKEHGIDGETWVEGTVPNEQ